MDREVIVALVGEVGQKEAAKRMGVSVSYMLKVAPECRTVAQRRFDAAEGNYVEPTGYCRSGRPQSK